MSNQNYILLISEMWLSVSNQINYQDFANCQLWCGPSRQPLLSNVTHQRSETSAGRSQTGPESLWKSSWGALVPGCRSRPRLTAWEAGLWDGTMAAGTPQLLKWFVLLPFGGWRCSSVASVKHRDDKRRRLAYRCVSLRPPLLLMPPGYHGSSPKHRSLSFFPTSLSARSRSRANPPNSPPPQREGYNYWFPHQAAHHWRVLKHANLKLQPEGSRCVRKLWKESLNNDVIICEWQSGIYQRLGGWPGYWSQTQHPDKFV